MTIKEQWRLAEEEFGENAFNRFEMDIDNTGEYKGLDFNPIGLHPTLRLKPLAELFAHDDSFYIDAYRIWEYGSKYLCETCKTNQDAIDFLSYCNKQGIGEAFGKTFIRRKTSAALPFDLKRAQKGDAVQVIDKWSFEDSKPLKDVILQIVDKELCFRSIDYKGDGWFKCNSIYAKELRMKYPPRK